jgi:hypothetical protein
MKKFIGTIVIMLILTQPITSDCSYKVKMVSINIFQEYKQYLALNIGKTEQEKHTLEDLSKNMNLISKLLNNKNEVLASIQSIMNAKAGKKETMNDIQILKFQEFVKATDQNNLLLKQAFNAINAKKDFKIMQQAILKNEIDYNSVATEINTIYAFQSSAMDSLNNIIKYGDGLLKVL